MSGFGQKSGEGNGSDETRAPEKRCKRSASEKQRIVEAFKPGATVSAVAEAHGLHPTQLYRWRRLYGRKPKGNSGAALLPVCVAEERMEHVRSTRERRWRDGPGDTGAPVTPASIGYTTVVAFEKQLAGLTFGVSSSISIRRMRRPLPKK